MISALSEQTWIREAQAGSESAFALLIRAHQQDLRSFLRRLCGSHAEADDLAQESFVFAWRAMHRFDTTRSFRPWLMGIGFRKYRESKRSWLRRMTREARYGEGRESSMDVDPGTRLDIVAALAELPADQRAVMILCLGQEFSHAEAAEALGLPLGTVKSHVTRGREKLIARLEDGHG